MATTISGSGLYIHVPFCRRRCGYCDFYSQVLDLARVEPLINAVLDELSWACDKYEMACETIFVGGGTPTSLPPEQLGRLLRACAESARGACYEFTVEVNPATVETETARVLADAGVNRVSIGAQSFNEAELNVLERTHRPAQVAETVAICRAAGIRNVNFDLIFAIPGQTLASWRASLEAAMALEPDHLSCYGLTYEPGTHLRRQWRAGLVERVDEDLEADMYETALDTLAAAGYPQYEISNFARPGAECRHNLAIWHNQPYLGLGPSAAGFVDGIRYKNVSDTSEYVRAIQAGRLPRVEQEQLDQEERARETAMLALRLREGLDRRSFAQRFGRDPVDFFADAVNRHVRDGLLEVDERAVRLTRPGLLLADIVIADFLVQGASRRTRPGGYP